jgi:uncharacterized Zn finger protein
MAGPGPAAGTATPSGRQRGGYEQAVSLLVEVSEGYKRAGARAEFADYMRGLRAAHRRKRTFIAALDAARLPG